MLHVDAVLWVQICCDCRANLSGFCRSAEGDAFLGKLERGPFSDTLKNLCGAFRPSFDDQLGAHAEVRHRTDAERAYDARSSRLVSSLTAGTSLPEVLP